MAEVLAEPFLEELKRLRCRPHVFILAPQFQFCCQTPATASAQVLSTARSAAASSLGMRDRPLSSSAATTLAHPSRHGQLQAGIDSRPASVAAAPGCRRCLDPGRPLRSASPLRLQGLDRQDSRWLAGPSTGRSCGGSCGRGCWRASRPAVDGPHPQDLWPSRRPPGRLGPRQFLLVMSWSELERLVLQAEADDALRRSLSHCRSRAELVLASRHLGFRITRHDIHRAWLLHVKGSPSAEHSDRTPAAGLEGLGSHR